jgi:glucose dehydrogenase
MECNLSRNQLASGLISLTAAILLASGCSKAPEDQPSIAADGAANARLVNAAAEPQNWLTHGGTYAEQRFSPLDQINRENVAGMRLAWFYDLDTNRGQEATPLIVDGVMYTSTAWSKVVALDAATGTLLWQFDPKVPPEKAFSGCCDVVNRGLAFYDGRQSTLVAADDRSGPGLYYYRSAPDRARQGADRQWRRRAGRARICHRL